MPKLPIDLGMSMKEGPMEPSEMPEKMYPSLHLDWESDYDLPDSGTMTVRFKKTSENKSNRDGKKRFSVGLDILEITAVNGKKDSKKHEESSGDALDRVKKEVEAEKENSDEDDESY